MMIRVGLIGFGLSGRVFHAPLIASVKGMVLATVVTSRQEEVRQHYPDTKVVANASVLLNDPEIDLVVVTTPNHLHYQMVMDALQAGKHVVVEKPMTVTSAQAEELCCIANQNQRCLAVYHNRRWDGDFLTISRLIVEGKLGEVHRLELQYDRYRPSVRTRWKEQNREGGGVLYDLGAHLLDQSLQLFGQPSSIYAQIRTLRKGAGAPDDFLVHLHYPDTEVILRSSSLATASGPRWLVLGSLGSFIKYGEDPQESQLAAGMKPLQPGFGNAPEAPRGCLTDADGKDLEIETAPGAYLQFYQRLRDAITLSAPVPVSGKEGAEVIRLIEAALQSSRQNSVVDL